MVVYNPNCSELVIPLDCETEEEIREALKAVEKITGWKLHLEIEVVKKDDLYNSRYVFLPVAPEDIIVEGEEILVKEEKIPEIYLNSSHMVLVLKHPTENIDPKYIRLLDEVAKLQKLEEDRKERELKEVQEYFRNLAIEEKKALHDVLR